MKQIRKTSLERQLEEGVLKQLNTLLGSTGEVKVVRASESIPPARAAYNVTIMKYNMEKPLRTSVTINEVKIFLEGMLACLNR